MSNYSFSRLPLIFVICLFCAAPVLFRQAVYADDIPIVAIPVGVTHVDDIGLYGVTYRYTDGRTGSKPVGWSGHFDDETGISVTPFGDQNGKQVFLTHPIWRGGAGDTDQTFRLHLPVAKSISLTFSIAMQTAAVGRSDGATFRLFINGTKQLDQNKTDSAWADERSDLTPFAGKVITITFEVDPGPKNDSSFDYAFWGDRTITATGGASKPLESILKPLNIPLDSQQAGWGSDSPTHFVKAEHADPITSHVVTGPKTLFDGLFFLIGHGKSLVSVPFAADASLDLVGVDGTLINTNSAGAAVKLQTFSPVAGPVTRIATYMAGGRQITVMAKIDHYDGSCVRLTVSSDTPYISAFHFGSIGPLAFQRHIGVPYYGSIAYSSDLGAYLNVYADYGLSHAARLDQGTAY